MGFERVAGFDLPQQKRFGRGGVEVFGQSAFALQHHDELLVDGHRVAAEAQQGDLSRGERRHAVERIEIGPLLFLAFAVDRVHLHVVLAQVHPVQGLLETDDPLDRVGVVLSDDGHQLVGVAGPHVVDVDQLAHQRDEGVVGGTTGGPPLQKPDHQLGDGVTRRRVFAAVGGDGFLEKRRELFSGGISLFRHGGRLPRRWGRWYRRRAARRDRGPTAPCLPEWPPRRRLVF